MTRDEAIKATFNAAIAAWVSAAFTTVVVAVAVFRNSAGDFAYWNDPLAVIDFVVLAGLAFGVYRKSRALAIVLLLYFIAAKIIMVVDTGKIPGIAISLIFVYFFAKGIIGAFAFHRIEREGNPTYRPTSRARACAIGAASFLTVTLITIALLSTLGVTPSYRVEAGDEISTATVRTLTDSGVITADEDLLFAYPHGAFSVLDGGNLLTDTRVILYYREQDGSVVAYSIPLDEVTDVQLVEQGGSFSDSVYIVGTADPDNWIQLVLSTERNGDEKFVHAIRKRIAQKQPDR